MYHISYYRFVYFVTKGGVAEKRNEKKMPRRLQPNSSSIGNSPAHQCGNPTHQPPPVDTFPLVPTTKQSNQYTTRVQIHCREWILIHPLVYLFLPNSIQIVMKKSEKNDNVEYNDTYQSIKIHVQIRSTHRETKKTNLDIHSTLLFMC